MQGYQVSSAAYVHGSACTVDALPMQPADYCAVPKAVTLQHSLLLARYRACWQHSCNLLTCQTCSGHQSSWSAILRASPVSFSFLFDFKRFWSSGRRSACSSAHCVPLHCSASAPALYWFSSMLHMRLRCIIPYTCAVDGAACILNLVCYFDLAACLLGLVHHVDDGACILDHQRVLPACWSCLGYLPVRVLPQGVYLPSKFTDPASFSISEYYNYIIIFESVFWGFIFFSQRSAFIWPTTRKNRPAPPLKLWRSSWRTFWCFSILARGQEYLPFGDYTAGRCGKNLLLEASVVI